ncbi:hypothetical protein [Methylobacillus sp.]|uniref:hypothetical protein n=1 Tax=Methylobacillus sp. TaxID=56818 RepID=UPI002FE42169
MDLFFFNDFISIIKPKLRSIAYKTKAEYSLGDLENEAYILLEDFIAAHGRYPDLACPKDINWVPARLGFRYVKHDDYRLKKAFRIHADDESDTPAFDIPAPEQSNPLFLLLFNEDHVEKQQLLMRSYSEAIAYLISFDHFDANKKKLSAFLCITPRTLGQHIEKFIKVYTVQPSLFDRLETIDHAFMPYPGIPKTRIGSMAEAHQFFWKF